ncbi:MAG TPA: CsgG/HfaB family protein [Patescibacteria group bacterium]|nr:CsgG/HfaB family protein [Patescibacteria group bacterium]
MKRTANGLVLCSLLLLTLMLCSVQTAFAAETGGLRYTVTVAKFENRAGWSGQWDVGDAWGLVMTDILNQTGRFIVLGEKDMRIEALQEQDLGASGRTAQGIAPPIGQMTPAQLIVKGAITHIQDTAATGGAFSVGGVTLGGGGGSAEVNVTMYMVDSTTGQVVASKSVVGKSGSSSGFIGYSGNGWSGGIGGFRKSNVGKAIENAVSQGVEWMVGQLPRIHWKGSVIMVRDSSVYINRGSREGVKQGQVFVVGSSEIIRDPSTGEVLDESVTEVARIRVATLKEKLAICEMESGQSSSIEKGMGVQLP